MVEASLMIQYRGALELCVVSKRGDQDEMKERLKHWLKTDIQDLSKILLWKKTKFKQHTFKNTTATLLEKKEFLIFGSVSTCTTLPRLAG